MPKPKPHPKKARKPIRRTRVRQKAGKPKRFADRREPGLLEFARSQICMLAGYKQNTVGGISCVGRTEAAHLKSRGAGGDDRNNVLSFCTAHHREQHAMGWQSFAEKYWGGYDIAEQHAIDLTVRYDRERSVG